jgi:hypothetical protein
MAQIDHMHVKVDIMRRNRCSPEADLKEESARSPR